MNKTMPRATIQRLSTDLIDSYLRAFSPAVMNALGISSHEAERTYLLEQLQQMENGKALVLAIMDQNEVIGAILFRDPVTYSRQGQLYCWINERYWSTGLFHSAFRQALEVYKKVPGNRIVTACVDIENIRSYKALKKLGFADSGYSQGARGKQYELILRCHK